MIQKRNSPARIDLNLRQLEAFVSAAMSGSFRQAALQCKQSQSTISRLIGAAERTLSIRLFDRDTRHVKLTSAGHELLPIARRILLEFDDSMSDLAEFLAGQRGKVSIAALPSVSAALLPEVISKFIREHPLVTLDVREASTENLLKLVEEGQVDLGICARPDATRHLQYHYLGHDPFMLICPKDDPLASRDSVDWDVFSGRSCVVAVTHTSIRAVTDAVFMSLGVPARVVLNYQSTACAVGLAASGVGLCALPQLALQPLDMSAVAMVSLRNPIMSRQIGIVTRVGRTLPPAALAFHAEVEAHVSSSNKLRKITPAKVDVAR